MLRSKWGGGPQVNCPPRSVYPQPPAHRDERAVSKTRFLPLSLCPSPLRYGTPSPNASVHPSRARHLPMIPVPYPQYSMPIPARTRPTSSKLHFLLPSTPPPITIGDTAVERGVSAEWKKKKKVGMRKKLPEKDSRFSFDMTKLRSR